MAPRLRSARAVGEAQAWAAGEAGAGRVVAPAAGAVAAALLDLCAQPERLVRFAEAGRAAYQRRYRWEVEAGNLRGHLHRADLAG